MHILQTDNVNKRFGGLVAINNISFDVENGEIFGIAGPNGAGKTTLFNVLTGLLPSTGDIFFNGSNISGKRPNKICHLGMTRTFQMPTLFSTLSILKAVMLGSHFGRPEVRDDKYVLKMIDFVGLKGKEKAIPGQLDLFDKKLTMLAANLATQPKLLLLDEPIAGLSLPQIDKTVSLIRKIRDELNVTIMIIEHFMKVLTEISDRLMIIHNGEKICIGEPKLVVRDNQVIKVYTGAANA